MIQEYKLRPPRVKAALWELGGSTNELVELTGGNVRFDFYNSKFEVYDSAMDFWMEFNYGDYIVYDGGLLQVVTGPDFLNRYEL